MDFKVWPVEIAELERFAPVHNAILKLLKGQIKEY